MDSVCLTVLSIACIFKRTLWFSITVLSTKCTAINDVTQFSVRSVGTLQRSKPSSLQAYSDGLNRKVSTME